MSIETYESEMHKKISDYNKWVNEHPIKSIEYMIGCKFKWHQKLNILLHHYIILARTKVNKIYWDRFWNKYIK